MVGPYGVNFEGYPIDVYYKGGNILNTLRTITDDDEKWRGMLRSLGQHFYHKTTNSTELEMYISQNLNLNLQGFFDHYLRDFRVPIFEYYFKNGKLNYRWTNAIDSFDMPVDVFIEGNKIRLYPRTAWSEMEVEGVALTVDQNYYIGVLKSR